MTLNPNPSKETMPKAAPAFSKSVVYTTPDGVNHATAEAAAAHVATEAMREALAAAFPEDCLVADAPGVSHEGDGHLAVFGYGVADFIFANRAAILAALSVAPKVRKPRGPNKPKVAKVEKAEPKAE